jgi:hypothetical protein
VRFDVCRAFFPSRTAKYFFHFFPCITNPLLEKMDLCRASEQNTLQTNIFAMRFPSRTAKYFFHFCLASQIHRLKKWAFAVRPDKTHGKQIPLPCVFCLAHGKVFFQFFPKS